MTKVASGKRVLVSLERKKKERKNRQKTNKSCVDWQGKERVKKTERERERGRVVRESLCRVEGRETSGQM